MTDLRALGPYRSPPTGRIIPLGLLVPLLLWAVAYVLAVIVPASHPLACFAQDLALPPLMLVACAVAGYALLDRLHLTWLGGMERLLVGTGLGLGALGLATLGLGLAGWTNLRLAPPILLLLGVVRLPRLMADLARWRSQAMAALGPFAWTTVGLATAMAAFLLWSAWTLPTDHATLARHLALPRAYLEAGAVRPVPGNVFGYLPLGASMLFQVAMSLRWIAGHLHASVESGVLLANVFGAYLVVLAAAASRIFGARAAAPAAALYLALPIVYRTSHAACAESALALYAALAVLALAVYRDGRRAPEPRGPVGAAVLVGVFAGLALGTTLTAAALVLLPILLYLAVDALARRPRRTGLWAVVGCVAAAALVVAPWWVRAAAWTGSPVYPFLTTLFAPGPYGSPEAARLVAAYVPSAGAWMVFGWPVAPESLLAAVSASLLLGLGATALLKACGRCHATLYVAAYAVAVLAGKAAAAPSAAIVLAPLWPLLAAFAAGGVVRVDAVRARRVAAAAAMVIIFFGFLYVLRGERAATTEQVLGRALPDVTDYSAQTVEYLNRGLDLPESWCTRPPDGAPVAVGLVGEDRTLYFVRPVLANTVWDRPWLAPALEAWRKTGSPDAVRAVLAEQGVATIYANWAAVGRLEGPACAAWPQEIRPALFDAWVEAGILKPIRGFGGRTDAKAAPSHALYRVAYSPGGE